MNDSNRKPVALFTGGGGAGNEALSRLMSPHWDLHFADADRDAIAPQIERHQAHKIPFARDPDFVDAMVTLAKELEATVVVPTVDEELVHAPAIEERLEGTMLYVPEASFVSTMLDKQATAAALASVGLDHPWTHTLERSGDVTYPCLAKPRAGRGSRGVRVLQNQAEAEAYVLLSEVDPRDLIAQELLTGVEYTVQMIADRSRRLHAIVPVKVDIKRGVTIRASVVLDDAVIAACQSIHEALPTSGCYNIQLMRSESGRVTPFEINPRVSTTFCMTVALGLDPLRIYLEDQAPEGLASIEAGLRLSRHWSNHLV